MKSLKDLIQEARSHKKAFGYNLTGAQPKKGKQQTSRTLRRKANQRSQQLTKEPANVPGSLDDPRDKVRGKAGSRSADRGWAYFGDGRSKVPQKMARK